MAEVLAIFVVAANEGSSCASTAPMVVTIPQN